MENFNSDRLVIISGAGIAGLSLGLTLHRIGIPFIIFDSVKEIQPLGVGINLQPNAVRELFELGVSESDLDLIGVQTREWALVGSNGQEIYSEARGRNAGYFWPQYSVHRGKLQMLLYEKLVDEVGQGRILTGYKINNYEMSDSFVRADYTEADGTSGSVEGIILVGADGLHSNIRALMYPSQPPLHWGGAIMWRGTTLAKPIRSGASFVGLGTDKKRVIMYPISGTENSSGKALINWIAEVTLDIDESQTYGDWNKRVEIESFIHHFENWRYEWLNIPSFLRQADCAYEFPMIDRDPIPTWVDERVVLIGDAAHVMYPTGSNGASQAIIDSRELGAAFIKYSVSPKALKQFDKKLCKSISELILRNREAGPFGILKVIDDRCGGFFNNINDVVTKSELDHFMANYKAAAGLAIKELNGSSPIIDAQKFSRNS